MLLAFVAVVLALTGVVIVMATRGPEATSRKVGGVTVIIDKTFYQEDGNFTALLSHGTVEVTDDRCLGIREERSARMRSIMWPHGTTVRKDDSGKPVITFGGKSYSVGDEISFGWRQVIDGADLPDGVDCGPAKVRLIEVVG